MIAVDIHKTDAALSGEITVAMSPGFDGRPPYQISSCPDLIHGCPVERLRQCRSERRELQYNFKSPCPDLIRASTVLAGEITKPPEDVDGRVKPGHGDLWLSKDRCRQPISLNRTAVDLIRASTSWKPREPRRRKAGWPGQARPWGSLVILKDRRCGAVYNALVGRIRVRHMCATGLLSKPSPSLGCLKLRPITSVKSSRSTTTSGSNE